jgi:hypothetical protein
VGLNNEVVGCLGLVFLRKIGVKNITECIDCWVVGSVKEHPTGHQSSGEDNGESDYG